MQRTIKAGVIIIAAGYGTMSALRQVKVRAHLRLRMWRSHLLVVPRANTRRPIFWVDYGRPSIFPQGEHALIGLNSDNQHVRSMREPALAGTLERYEQAVESHFPRLLHSRPQFLRECFKVDLGSTRDVRSVGAVTEQVDETTWLQFPGKLTTAPVNADRLVAALAHQRKI